jgi:hypothetical protein
MGLGRTILAALIGLSVAILPAAGVAAFKLKPQDATEISAAEPTHDCCPPAADPCEKAMDDCRSMAACALKCFSYSGGVSSPLIYPWSHASPMPLLRSGPSPAQLSSPPFRPPRI